MEAHKRMYFVAGTEGKCVEVIALTEENALLFTCVDDWYGDSETGLGAAVTIRVSRDDAARLRDFIDGWLKTPITSTPDR